MAERHGWSGWAQATKGGVWHQVDQGPAGSGRVSFPCLNRVRYDVAAAPRRRPAVVHDRRVVLCQTPGDEPSPNARSAGSEQ